jgi:hypothetical protein
MNARGFGLFEIKRLFGPEFLRYILIVAFKTSHFAHKTDSSFFGFLFASGQHKLLMVLSGAMTGLALDTGQQFTEDCLSGRMAGYTGFVFSGLIIQGFPCPGMTGFRPGLIDSITFVTFFAFQGSNIVAVCGIIILAL